jgi:hypothetical protein
MRTYAIILIKILPALLLLLSGCATKAPTIAHTHIGHTMDGWPITPDQAGLFVTAENSAQAALQTAEAARAEPQNLTRIKYNIAQVLSHTNPLYHGSEASSEKKQYGVKNALAEASRHIIFAAESPDASDNVRNSALQFSDNANYVLNRCDLITLLGDEILNSTSAEEANILSNELIKLTHANLDGDDSDGDGIIGSTPEEYGLKQLRAELLALIDREGPDYSTVSTWYLFNLIRLPSGEWAFNKRGGGSDGGGNGGGGNGGY